VPTRLGWGLVHQQQQVMQMDMAQEAQQHNSQPEPGGWGGVRQPMTSTVVSFVTTRIWRMGWGNP
jgi:hypothetical protein